MSMLVHDKRQLVLHSANASTPAHDVHIEGEKTQQKAIQRRTIDSLGPYITWLEERGESWDRHCFRAMVPNAAAATKILPPVGYLCQPATSFTQKYVTTSVNKIRCSIDSIAWTPDGRRCLTGSHRGEFTLWNGNTFKFEGILQAHEAAITCMRYTHNENWLMTCDGIGRVKYWKGRNELVKEFEAHKECVRCTAFAPTDVKFVTASTDSTLKVWNFATYQEERALSGHARDVLSCDWHPNLSAIVSSSRDYTIRLWDARLGGESLSSLEGHRGEVPTVQWHSNGHSILSSGRDNQAKIWDTRTMKELSNFSGSQAPINCASWHPIHGDVFVTGGHDGAILFWCASRPTIQAEVLGAHEGAVWSLAWHPQGHLLATGGADHCSRFWCRARPGDAWRDKSRGDQDGISHPFGMGPVRPGNFSVASGGIPGIADTVPGLAVAPGMPGGFAGPHMGQMPFPGFRPPFGGQPRLPAPRPPPGAPPPSAGSRRSHSEAFKPDEPQRPFMRPRLQG